jgi:hypothetical protein
MKRLIEVGEWRATGRRGTRHHHVQLAGRKVFPVTSTPKASRAVATTSRDSR